MMPVIERQDRQFRLLVEGITDYAIYMLSPDGTIVSWNTGAERAKGYRSGEILGRHFSIFYRDEDRQAGVPETALRAALVDGRFEAFGWRVRKDGTEFWADVVITPVFDARRRHVGFAKITRDRTEHNRVMQQLAHLARHDVLTGLPNRLALAACLDDALTRAQGDGGLVAVVTFDLDGFKVINDLQGHDAGDMLLSAIAFRIGQCLREGELVARYGGDEFVGFTPCRSCEEAQDFVRRLQTAISSPVTLPHGRINPSASFGIALYPTHADNRESLISNADLAMYRAKSATKTRVRIYEAEMDQVARRRRTLGLDLRMGVGRGQFVLHYQKQLDLKSGGHRACEALLRWNHPTFGMISPATFIPIAEENGEIARIGAWVLRQACRDAHRTDMARVAVNLSAREVQDPQFPDLVERIIERERIEPGRLELEITESMTIQDIAVASKNCRRLKDIGVSFALDDFGAGYSTFDALRALPLDVIKLDRSLLQDLGVDMRAGAFVRGILAMARAVGLKVLAEGVETEQQLGFLRAEGCDYAQGYFIGRPEPLTGSG
ncbi:putative bifunctional diguanylate cyclase/phosphodiesterase [Aureimonas altamirensis]|uniref:putative bifunctional diguanylate cyclase/phosphodiesterase n=1 Tax=Aureimonas altamirensis TaxID=370622 RepID=UPI002556CFB2|nr:GGDEF and EAL domain-containing protein [Aureimonas altamirensis]